MKTNDRDPILCVTVAARREKEGGSACICLHFLPQGYWEGMRYPHKQRPVCLRIVDIFMNVSMLICAHTILCISFQKDGTI